VKVKVLPSILTILAVIFLSGCASLPEDLQRTTSYAHPEPQDTVIAKFFAEAASTDAPHKTGVRLLEDPREAFLARYSLSSLAQHTLDFQYYLWKDDETGILLLDQALAAADRGVKVRILIDDIYHRGRDHDYGKIASHPNVELRVFNPSSKRKLGRYLEIFLNQSTLNRRMHNKIFLVDNAVAVLGGRNIGNDYFGTDLNLNFRDLDALVVGDVAAQAGAAFDAYWNSARAVRAEALNRKALESGALEKTRGQINTRRDEFIKNFAYPLPTSPIPTLETLEAVRDQMVWTDAELVVDDLQRFEESRESDVYLFLRELSQEIESELLIQTAYLIPTKETVAGFKKLVDRGVRVRIMTNSMMSNNHLAVHAHYKKKRKALLKAGVELYELRVDDALLEYLSEEGSHFAESNAGLHTKSFVVDGRTSVIGSYNMDPRSRVWNSEMALVVHGEAIGQQVQDLMEEAMSPKHCYQVMLNESGRLEWVLDLPEGRQVLTKEPNSNWWIRSKTNFMSWLPIGNQL
jgi:putative cardiolipin synthase